MLYIYIDEDSTFGVSRDKPTDSDLESFTDGRLDIIRISLDGLGRSSAEIYVGGHREWSPVPVSMQHQGEDGQFYHAV